MEYTGTSTCPPTMAVVHVLPSLNVMHFGVTLVKMRIPIILVFLLLAMPQANAFWGFAAKITWKITKISSSPKTLPVDEIIRLSKLSDEVNGTAKVGNKLGKLHLPNDVHEDAFLRIAIYQRIVTRTEAEGI